MPKKVTTHTSESLKAMKLPELRKIAKKLGLTTTGLRVAELVKAILKAQKKAGGAAEEPASKKKKGKKAASSEKASKKKKGKKAAAAAEGTEDEDEEEAEEPAASVSDAVMKEIAKFRKRLDAVEAALAKLAKADDDDEEEEDEPEEDDDEPEETEEDEEDEEEADEEEADEEEEDEDAEEDGEDETLEITTEDLASANLERLQEMAEAINESVGETAIEYEGVKSPRKLRERIKEFMDENAEVVADEEPVSKKASSKKKAAEPDEDEEEETEFPEFCKKGAKVKIKYEGEWFTGKITAVPSPDDEERVTVFFDEDEEEADVLPNQLKPLKK